MPRPRWTTIGWLILTLVLATACSADGLRGQDGSQPWTEDVTFRPIDDIVEGDLRVTDFADGTARLPVVTSIPVACSVVYGLTPDFGFLTLDDEMAGSPHSIHDPLLTNLREKTTYYYRFQGADENGVIYISETMTFTTPAFHGDTGPVENLASPERGAQITSYSSAFGDSSMEGHWGAAHAFDGNPTTEWASAGDGNEAWIEVRLARRAQIDTVEFWSRSMGDGSSITLAFTLTTDSGDVFGPFSVSDATTSHRFDVAVEGRTLRFDLVDTTGGNTGVVDIAIYGVFIEA